MIPLLIEAVATPLAIVGLFGALYALTYWPDWIRRRPEPARREGRISSEERRLLGEDWRECLRRPVR
jgi:hypothetical protein